MKKQLISFLMPLTMAFVLPFWFLVANSEINKIYKFSLLLPLDIVSLLIMLIGLMLLISTISLFINVGKGTLAPWSPTQKLVIKGPYRYTRNPMITGVLLVVIAEAIFFWSMTLAIYAFIFWLVNTIYFIASEEPGLEKRFGESYRRYKKAVPMWLPRLSPYKAK